MKRGTQIAGARVLITGAGSGIGNALWPSTPRHVEPQRF